MTPAVLTFLLVTLGYAPANPYSRPVFLTGKVVLEDGTPPPDSVRIERVCGGQPVPQGYTDPKGLFQFQLDFEPGVESQAADVSPRAADSLGFACDLRAVLPGFLSSSISLADHVAPDNPDVGIIVLRRSKTVDGTTISVVSLAAPRDAAKAYEKGRELLTKRKQEEAQRSFQKAVDLYPRYAAAWYELGLLQVRDNRSQAEISFKRSIEADPKFVSPYLNLALLCEYNRRWDSALKLTEAVIQMNGTDFPQAHFYQAVADYNLGETDLAESTVRKAIELDVRHRYPQTEKLLAVILAHEGNSSSSAEHLHKYLELAPNAYDAREVRAKLVTLTRTR